jgi:hypothetical protein
MLVALAITLQGVPLIQLHLNRGDMQEPPATAAATAPCHSEQDAEQPGKVTSSLKSFACCGAFSCSMLAQALPPDAGVTAIRFVARYLRPTASQSAALAEPDPAWRPPARFI